MTRPGLLFGIAGSIEILGVSHFMIPSYGTAVGFDSIAVALLGRSHPFGIVVGGAPVRRLRAGRRADADRGPDPGRDRRRHPGDRSCCSWPPTSSSGACSGSVAAGGIAELKTVTKSYAEGGGPLMDRSDPLRDPGHRGPLPAHRLPRRDPSPTIAPISSAGHPDRPRRHVRDHERAVGRREHRHRGDDAEPAFTAFLAAALVAQAMGPTTPSPVFGITLPILVGMLARRRDGDARVGCSTPGCRSRSGPTRSSAGRSSTSSPGPTGYLNRLIISPNPRSGPASSSRSAARRPRRPALHRLDLRGVPRPGADRDLGPVPGRLPPDLAVPIALGPPDASGRRASQGRGDRRDRRDRAPLPQRRFWAASSPDWPART